MANATVVRTLKDVVTTKRVRDGVTLKLSNEEAIFLRSLLDNVGGDPVRSVRRYSNAISKALSYADVPGPPSGFSGGIMCISGSLDPIMDSARELEEK